MSDLINTSKQILEGEEVINEAADTKLKTVKVDAINGMHGIELTDRYLAGGNYYYVKDVNKKIKELEKQIKASK